MVNKRGENRKFSPCIFSSKNRKGSHVDVILSFVIFISFIIFFYAMIQSNVLTRGDKTTFLNFMGGKLIENLTGGDLIRINTVISYSGGAQNCIYLDPFATSTGISSFNLIVKNSTGVAFPSSYSGNTLYINTSLDPQSTYSFDIYYSSSFNVITAGTMNGCKHLLEDNTNGYTIKQIENYSVEDYVWENNIKQLISLYNSSFASVRNEFNLVPSENFRFDFTYQNQTKIGTPNNIPVSVNVYSKLFPIVYVSENGPLEAGNLIVQVW